jgi:hypothetical protein
MKLTDEHVKTLKRAPFIIGELPGVPHELCRKGLLEWTDGAWRLTPAGHEALANAAQAA